LNQNERRREGSLHTDILEIPSFFQLEAIVAETIQTCVDAGKYPLSGLVSGLIFNRKKFLEICAGNFKNQNLFPFTRVLSGRVVASVPYYFASEAFNFVNDQVIHVEGGNLSVL
jgi:hypothetical protein